jgi:hypothetical protein
MDQLINSLLNHLLVKILSIKDPKQIQKYLQLAKDMLSLPIFSVNSNPKKQILVYLNQTLDSSQAIQFQSTLNHLPNSILVLFCLLRNSFVQKSLPSFQLKPAISLISEEQLVYDIGVLLLNGKGLSLQFTGNQLFVSLPISQQHASMVKVLVPIFSNVDLISKLNLPGIIGQSVQQVFDSELELFFYEVIQFNSTKPALHDFLIFLTFPFCIDFQNNALLLDCFLKTLQF